MMISHILFKEFYLLLNEIHPIIENMLDNITKCDASISQKIRNTNATLCNT